MQCVYVCMTVVCVVVEFVVPSFLTPILSHTHTHVY